MILSLFCFSLKIYISFLEKFKDRKFRGSKKLQNNFDFAEQNFRLDQVI